MHMFYDFSFVNIAAIIAASQDVAPGQAVRIL